MRQRCSVRTSLSKNSAIFEVPPSVDLSSSRTRGALGLERDADDADVLAEIDMVAEQELQRRLRDRVEVLGHELAVAHRHRGAVGDDLDRRRRVVFEPDLARALEVELAGEAAPVAAGLHEIARERRHAVEIGVGALDDLALGERLVAAPPARCWRSRRPAAGAALAAATRPPVEPERLRRPPEARSAASAADRGRTASPGRPARRSRPALSAPLSGRTANRAGSRPAQGRPGERDHGDESGQASSAGVGASVGRVRRTSIERYGRAVAIVRRSIAAEVPISGLNRRPRGRRPRSRSGSRACRHGWRRRRRPPSPSARPARRPGCSRSRAGAGCRRSRPSCRAARSATAWS